ncbi:MAG: DUF692 domain-containing protein [Myxococcales bacterium]
MAHGTKAEGIGLGLRHALARELFEAPHTPVRWLEIHPENYLQRGGRYETMLGTARERFPLLTHGLTMAFGSVAPFEQADLRELRGLLAELEVPWHSDHLCFAGVDGVFAHDLLPLPFNRECVDVVVDRVHQAQDALGVPIALEHISYYAHAPGGSMSELEHLVEVLERSDAKLLLDVNNVFVNSQNHGFDPRAFIDGLPLERVVQLHVAGHLVRPDGLRIDTHAEPVCEEVFALFEYTMGKLGRRLPVLLERDDNFPALSELLAEVTRLDAIYQRALQAAEASVLPKVAV